MLPGSVRVAGMEFESQPEFQRQPGAHPEAVLRIGIVVIGDAVVIHLHIVEIGGCPEDPSKKVGERRARELSGEIEIAVVVAAHEPQRIDGLNMAVIESELERMLAERPGYIVDSLEGPAVRDALQPVGIQSLSDCCCRIPRPASR